MQERRQATPIPEGGPTAGNSERRPSLLAVTAWGIFSVLLTTAGTCKDHHQGSTDFEPEKTVKISAAGGRITNGVATLDIQSGAVEAPVSITTASHPAPSVTPANGRIVSSVFQFGPAGLRFQKPALLTIALSKKAAPGMRLTVAEWSEVHGQVRPLHSRLTENAISAAMTHFSSFVVAEVAGCPSSCDENDETSCCNGACVYMGSTKHCGDCNPCAESEGCCQDRFYDFPLFRCVNLQTSEEECGKCGIECKKGIDCCAGLCTDVNGNDNENCGGCGVPCGPAGDMKCERGKCVAAHKSCSVGGTCPYPELCCRDFKKPTPTSRCIDIETDDNNCGGCDVKCSESNTAGPNSHCCGGTCHDFQIDPKHCGGCGVKCLEGKTCVAGKCECPAGRTDCGGTCVDLQTDPKHCGGCDKPPCPEGKTCVAGKCGCSAGSESCFGTCCAPGQRCWNAGALVTKCCNEGETGFTDNKGSIICCPLPRHICLPKTRCVLDCSHPDDAPDGG